MVNSILNSDEREKRHSDSMEAAQHSTKKNLLIKLLESFQKSHFKSQDIGTPVMDVLRQIKQWSLLSGRNRDPFT